MFILYAMMVSLIMIENVWNFATQKQDAQQASFHNNVPLSQEPFDSHLDKETQSQKDFHQPPKSELGYQFAYSSLSDQDIPSIITMLSKLSPQKALFLAHNSISDHGFLKLVSYLKQTTSINHLILSHNSLQFSEFAKAGLADLLKVNRYIGWLVFNHNDISDIGAKHLAFALKHNKAVKHLVLSDNHITDTGVFDLLSNLNHHPTLESLFLANNHLTLASIPFLIDFVKTSKSLKRLDISGHFNTNHPSLTELKNQCELHGIRLHY